MSISWGKQIDNHVKGESEIGKVYIRLDRKGKVTGMYTLFGTTEKYMPDQEWMTDVLGAQLELERLYELETKSREISKIINK